MADDQQAMLLAAIQRLNDIGIDLSREHDEDHMLERILVAAKDLTRADGGSIYSMLAEDALRFRIIHTDSLGLAQGGQWGPIVGLPDIPLYREGEPNHASVVAHAVLERTTVVIDDAYAVEDFDFSGTRAFDARTGYRSVAMLTVPMCDHRDEVIGVLQLLNPHDAAGAMTTFNASQVRLVESLASQASIMLTNGQLVQQVSNLFESFVKLIAHAIDEKSPYTGSHCRRVPELTMSLAEAAHATAVGPLADFQLSDDDRYELRIASWLHDCGKITTPEWIMDKATKLERIHDRINEVATRFAVLRQMILGEYAAETTDVSAGGSAAAAQRRDADLQQLDDDLNFLKRVNIGGEHMSDEDVARVQAIAQRQWQDAHGQWLPLLRPDEVDNLCVRRGTLLREERDIINHHIVATIDMLEQLPFPKHLRHVPEIAGGHHERMDGRGYPRGLTREQMSVQARCMGIADIFEALTAADRPYKKAMPLSQALHILGNMKLNGHIDPDLFDIFIRDGIWRRYAEDYLRPEQNDAVDLRQIPGYQAAVAAAGHKPDESP
ncbi:MAG: GAF domain-containing protein [Planctomycetota bacterium]|nr:MAG: GAF domain-containing protein [Planctomycetota bacterium]